MLLAGVAVATLAVATVWSIDGMYRKRDAAQKAAEDLVVCKDLAHAVESLRDEPTVASTEDMGIQELGKRIESASQQAKLNGASLEGVFPQPARRVGDSPYLYKPTTLVLRRVSLPQLATYLFYLTTDSGLNVHDLRLRTPRGEAASDVWDAETTLTYLIYAPPTKTRRDQ